ncbi:MAG TPA: hypothetical protein DD435_13015 [Cyanobacteria bacterium UBA8530]|nr:hypothetical protein [Cyanobacteria bacterium UBA8530]
MRSRSMILLALSMGLAIGSSVVAGPAAASNVGDTRVERTTDKTVGVKDGVNGNWFLTKETTYRFSATSILPNTAPAFPSVQSNNYGKPVVDMGGLAVDGAGNVYTANWSAGKTVVVDKNGNMRDLGMWEPWPSTDSHGNVYLSNAADGKIYKVDTAGNKTLVYQTSAYARCVVDANDDMYLLEGSTISKVDHVTKAKTVITNGPFSRPSTLNVDKKGNVYLTNWGPYAGEDGKVYQITPDGKSKVVYENTSFQGQVGVGPDGSIYVGDYTDGCVYMVDPETGSKTKVLSGVNPRNLSFDKDGNMYAQTGSGVLKVKLK